jgi:hypothetical protein
MALPGEFTFGHFQMTGPGIWQAFSWCLCAGLKKRFQIAIGRFGRTYFQKTMQRGFLILWVVLVGWATSGCVQTRVTEPRRTATEQLMISTAADRSLSQAPMLDAFQGKKVFVDTTYFDSYDESYVIGALRQRLSEHGALLVTNAVSSDVVLEPRSAALSTDSATSMIGMPSLPLPAALSGGVSTPELYLLKSQKLYSTAKLALFAYDEKSRRHFYSSGDLLGKATLKYYTFIGFIKITRTDLPEKK